MKLNKEKVKEGLKNQCIIILNMIIFNIISFGLFYTSYLGITPTGNKITVESSYYPISLSKLEYEANPFFVIFFWILFLLVFSIFYSKFLKNDFKKQMKIHWIFVLLSFLVSVIFVLVELAIYAITSMMMIGFGSVINYPSFIGDIVLIYIIAYILIDIIREIKKKNENNNK